MRFHHVLAIAVVLVAPASAQEFKRSVLQRADVPQGAAYETVLGTAEIPPKGTTGRHTHPGVELLVVIQGEMDVLIEGEAPKRLKAGDSLAIPSGKVHDVHTMGEVPAKVVVTWMVEKGKPIASPAE